MKYILILSLVLLLAGCSQSNYETERAKIINRFNDESVRTIIDSQTNCKYIIYAFKGISPLYKNSSEVDCYGDSNDR
jgi:hypothetical protein